MTNAHTKSLGNGLKATATLVFLMVLASGITACGPAVSASPSADQPAANGEDGSDDSVELHRAAIGILNSQCLKCHGPSGSGGVSNITDLNALLAQGLITRGAPDSSRIIRVVESGSMPMGAPRMAPADIETLRKWIAGLKPAT